MRHSLILAATISMLGLGSARAELPGPGATGASLACQEDPNEPVNARFEMIDGKRTLVIEKKIVVCGHRARPTVAYVTNPKDVHYSWTQLTEDLTAKIVDSVKLLSGGRK